MPHRAFLAGEFLFFLARLALLGKLHCTALLSRREAPTRWLFRRPPRNFALSPQFGPPSTLRPGTSLPLLPTRSPPFHLGPWPFVWREVTLPSPVFSRQSAQSSTPPREVSLPLLALFRLPPLFRSAMPIRGPTCRPPRSPVSPVEIARRSTPPREVSLRIWMASLEVLGELHSSKVATRTLRSHRPSWWELSRLLPPVVCLMMKPIIKCFCLISEIWTSRWVSDRPQVGSINCNRRRFVLKTESHWGSRLRCKNEGESLEHLALL